MDKDDVHVTGCNNSKGVGSVDQFYSRSPSLRLNESGPSSHFNEKIQKGLIKKPTTEPFIESINAHVGIV